MLHALVVAALTAPFAQQSGIPLDPGARLERRITPAVEVVQACKPAVVFIRTEAWRPRGFDLWTRRQVNEQVSGAGSGVVVQEQGFVITNYHVVKGAQQVTVSFSEEFDDTQYPAQVVSFVEEEDLALLKIKAERTLPTIPLGTSADLMLGEVAIAIGCPGGRAYSVSQGIISGLHRDVSIQDEGLHFDDLIQTDAAINRGNSGGPLLNINGELIGINSSMDTTAQNIGFAIPVDRVKFVLQSRLMSPDAARTWLGFEVDNLMIRSVVDGSPAAQAGLQPGDCIVALGGQAVRTSEEYRLARISLPPKQAVQLRYERAGKARDASLMPLDANDGMIFQRLGLQCDEVFLGTHKVVRVLEVQKGGPAAQLGLESGDLFNAVRVQLKPRPRTFRIGSKNDLAEILNEQSPPGTVLELEVIRDVNQDTRYNVREELHRGMLTTR
jgi:serine protease Do